MGLKQYPKGAYPWQIIHYLWLKRGMALNFFEKDSLTTKKDFQESISSTDHKSSEFFAENNFSLHKLKIRTNFQF